jgi:tetratricopeptide (TPR) repeat protein
MSNLPSSLRKSREVKESKKPAAEAESPTAPPAIGAPIVDSGISVAQLKIESFVAEKAKLLLALLAVVTIGALGYGLYSSYRANYEVKAANALFIPKRDLITAIAKIPAEDTQWEGKITQELSALQKSLESFSNSKAAVEIRLLLGDLYFERKQFEKALPFYTEAEKSAPSAWVLQAQISKAYTLESLKKWPEAIKVQLQIFAVKDSAFRADAAMALARLNAAAGDTTKAKEYLSIVEREFPNTPVAKTAQIQKRQL